MDTRSADNDLGYFDIYGPAPMFEAMTRLSPASQINSTTTHIGPFMYGLSRLVKAESALEIGLAQGWSSGFMAWAIRENNLTYNRQGTYWGIDIAAKPSLEAGCTRYDLPAQFAYGHSVGWLGAHRNELPMLDVIFDDGWHNTEYVQQEIELLYPFLRKNGYLIMHDVYATCNDVFYLTINDPRYKWEYLRFLPSYGLALLRKLDGEEAPLPTRNTEFLSGGMQAAMFETIAANCTGSYLEALTLANEIDLGPFLYTLGRVVGTLGSLRCLVMGDDIWGWNFISNAANETNARYGNDSHVVIETDDALTLPHKPYNMIYLVDKATERIDNVYPMLQDLGHGYLFAANLDDDARNEIVGKYSWEHIRIGNHVLFRNMKNYDHASVYNWPDGDEKARPF